MIAALDQDTIAAISTAPGRGGIAIVRVSGPLAPVIAARLTGSSLPPPRRALRTSFLDASGQVMDDGVAIYFQAPHSFTGEDILELHGHGGHKAPHMVLDRVLQLGARRARPGEFSERAFLSGKIDLVQAEAIADLIDSSSEQAARAALRSMAGIFSARVRELADKLTKLRVFLEATLDFPDEDLDLLSTAHVLEKGRAMLVDLSALLSASNQGALLRDGLTLAMAGPPNAGKSSLLNALADQDAAIVTPIPGTTRDVIRISIQVDGLILQCADTAGLRIATDAIERLGIERTEREISTADLVLLILEDNGDEQQETWLQRLGELGCDLDRILVVLNKIDLSGARPGPVGGVRRQVRLSALTGAGLEDLRSVIKDVAGYQENAQGTFSARRRHVEALATAKRVLESGLDGFAVHERVELLAEDLRQTHRELGVLVGEFTSEDLLGEIFSSFCIGK